MRAPHAIFTVLIAAACGGKTTSPATLGNAGGGPPRRITVTAVDSTGGGHEDAIKAAADEHIAKLAHAQDGDALALTVTLTSVAVEPTVACHVQILVTTARDRAIVASLESSAEVGASSDRALAISDCIDGVIGSLIDTQLAQLVDARAGT